MSRHNIAYCALTTFTSKCLQASAKVVRIKPDFISIRVEELVGDRPFDDLDKFITQDELRALSEQYKRVAGFSLTDVGGGRAQ